MVGARWGGAGGIGGLVSLIARDGEALDADLQHHYHLSLNDLTAGRLTFRRLRGLVANLPPDGTAMWRAQRRQHEDVEATLSVVEPDSAWWTPERDMLALLADLMSLRIWQAGGGKGSKPRPISRPGVGRKARKRGGAPPLTVGQVADLMRSELGDDPAEHPADELDVHVGPEQSEEDPDDREP